MIKSKVRSSVRRLATFAPLMVAIVTAGCGSEGGVDPTIKTEKGPEAKESVVKTRPMRGAPRNVVREPAKQRMGRD